MEFTRLSVSSRISSRITYPISVFQAGRIDPTQHDNTELSFHHFQRKPVGTRPYSKARHEARRPGGQEASKASKANTFDTIEV